ncbi:MAG: hypothetical protein SO082_09465 [Candidatus Limisoma sp.]|nr:hypothetical protein [Candidatus Limisoma sp.]
MQSLRDSHHSRIYDTAAVQTCILAITQLASTRLPGRTEARPYDEWCFLRCIMLKISRVGSRLAATYQAMVSSPRLPGRTKARTYDRLVLSAMYYVENK